MPNDFAMFSLCRNCPELFFNVVAIWLSTKGMIPPAPLGEASCCVLVLRLWRCFRITSEVTNLDSIMRPHKQQKTGCFSSRKKEEWTVGRWRFFWWCRIYLWLGCRYEADNGSLVVLDTIGLGDTEIDQNKVARGWGEDGKKWIKTCIFSDGWNRWSEVVASIRDVALSAPFLGHLKKQDVFLNSERSCQGSEGHWIHDPWFESSLLAVRSENSSNMMWPM